MSSKLVGQYHTDKSNLLKPGLHLVIGTRRNPHPTKPRHYLLERIVPPPAKGEKHRYISGLYPAPDAPQSPTDAQIWHFDYSGRDYTLSLKPGGKAEISPKSGESPAPQNSTSSINNVELGCESHPKGNPQTGQDAAI